ncbi:hypothetical protein ACFR9U_04475 [Halorientalis brevis]|uniref:Uncharacterized protein n=1 Tax=Halorientalis brevis TaxID=1126241 RepID=A0ABD6C7F5_9EURY|nr:hypothetical protein [Halorientalis brevis]
MRRRTFLATTGALFSAGCSEIIPPPQTTVRSDAAGPNETTGPDGTGSETVPTDGSETTAPDDGRTSDHPTETETDTPTQGDREVAQAITTARSRLTDAHAAYLAFADATDPTLVDVTAATQVSVSDVTRHASKARQALEEAPNTTSPAQQTTVDRLSGVADFLATGIRYQSSANAAYSKFTFVLDRLYAEAFAVLPGEIGRLRTNRDTANEFRNTLQSETDRDDVQSFDAISATIYDEKVAQLDREMTGFETLADAISAISDGLEAFTDANGEFTDDSYGDAAEQYVTASERLGTATETLETLDAPTAVESAVTELTGVADAVASGAADLEAASRAGDEFEWETRDERFDDAISALQTSQVAVDRLDSVTEIIEYHERTN